MVERPSGLRRVVVGVSGSLGSLVALHRAVAEARARDGEVLAVLAWTPPGRRRRLGEAEPDARLDKALADAFAGAPPGVPLTPITVAGAPAEILLRTANRPTDLLVIGPGRRGEAIAAYCHRYGDCPVLTVPRPALQRELRSLRRRLTWRLAFVTVPADWPAGVDTGRVRRRLLSPGGTLALALACAAALTLVLAVLGELRPTWFALGAFTALAGAVGAASRPVAAPLAGSACWLFLNGFVIHRNAELGWDGLAVESARFGLLTAAALAAALLSRLATGLRSNAPRRRTRQLPYAEYTDGLREHD